MVTQPRIGVLALQGDVPEHLHALGEAGAQAVAVKTLAGLAAVDGLVIPGGESTTIGMLLERYGLMAPLRERIAAGMPLYGTCAGLILMAREVEGSEQPRLGCMDITVRRNAYGRQVDSFEVDVPAPELGGTNPLRAVFIRAPQITAIGPEVRILAEMPNGPILVRQGSLLGGTFHPEMTEDRRVHAYFRRMVQEQ
ncbi:MAG: pyridoxal 5'-phosphate synthase glutaminase subunit PdxT [Armatimonadetes bacterium]|nr:pyridoxal 5'-phosphate synthase glutaminase subunit PdxT [Armatimonadota bacterium]